MARYATSCSALNIYPYSGPGEAHPDQPSCDQVALPSKNLSGRTGVQALTNLLKLPIPIGHTGFDQCHTGFDQVCVKAIYLDIFLGKWTHASSR